MSSSTQTTQIIKGQKDVTIAEKILNAKLSEEIDPLKFLLIDLIYIYHANDIKTVIENFLMDEYKKADKTPYDVMLVQGDAGTGKSIMLRDIENKYWNMQTYNK